MSMTNMDAQGILEDEMGICGKCHDYKPCDCEVRIYHKPPYDCEVRIFNGLPLNCSFSISPADPNVGIMSAWVDDFQLTDRNGRYAGWAENKMTDADWSEVEQQCWDSLQ